MGDADTKCQEGWLSLDQRRKCSGLKLKADIAFDWPKRTTNQSSSTPDPGARSLNLFGVA
jgi:hypothetical protein